MTSVRFAARFAVALAASTILCAATARADDEPAERPPVIDTPVGPATAPAPADDEPASPPPLAPPPPAQPTAEMPDEEPASALPPATASPPPAATTIARAQPTVAASRPEARERPLQEVGFGVRAGATRLALDARRLSAMKLPMDDLKFEGLTVTPTFSFGGDGYFFRLDLPFTKAEAFDGYGLGLYPLNYGHLFRKLGLFPYVSAGVTGSLLKSAGQKGVSGGLGEARVAVGFKLLLAGGLAVSCEAGYIAYGAAVLVDQRRVKQIEEAAVAGADIELSPGNRPASGGAGTGFDFAVGLEWL